MSKLTISLLAVGMVAFLRQSRTRKGLIESRFSVRVMYLLFGIISIIDVAATFAGGSRYNGGARLTLALISGIMTFVAGYVIALLAEKVRVAQLKAMRRQSQPLESVSLSAIVQLSQELEESEPVEEPAEALESPDEKELMRNPLIARPADEVVDILAYGYAAQGEARNACLAELKSEQSQSDIISLDAVRAAKGAFVAQTSEFENLSPEEIINREIRNAVQRIADGLEDNGCSLTPAQLDAKIRQYFAENPDVVEIAMKGEYLIRLHIGRNGEISSSFQTA